MQALLRLAIAIECFAVGAWLCVQGACNLLPERKSIPELNFIASSTLDANFIPVPNKNHVSRFSFGAGVLMHVDSVYRGNCISDAFTVYNCGEQMNFAEAFHSFIGPHSALDRHHAGFNIPERSREPAFQRLSNLRATAIEPTNAVHLVINGKPLKLPFFAWNYRGEQKNC